MTSAGILVDVDIRSGLIEHQVVGNLLRPVIALDIKAVAFGIIGRTPAIIVDDAAIHEVVRGRFGHVYPVPGLIVDDQVDEAEVRRIGSDAGNDLDVRRAESDAGLAADPAGVRAIHFEIPKNDPANTVPDGK